jgi:hypothetical protein
VKEIVAGVCNFDATRALWNGLYAPAGETAGGVWQTGADAAVRLRRSDTNSIQTLVLKVSSLNRAETFLRESGMLGSVGEGHIKIDPSKLEGLDVRLVQ